MSSLKARAAETARLLDAVEPGWYNHINLDNLNMHIGCQCVIGQLRGSFFKSSVVNLGGPVSDKMLDRIAWGDKVGLSDSNGQYPDENLTEIWTNLVKKRLAA